MRLPPFQLHEPETLEEATELLEKYGEDARAIAGGTVLVPMMRYGLLRPGHLVSLGRVSDLRGTSVSAGELRIGALATHHCLSTCRDVRVGWPLLARAAGSVATPAIRATGTLGGNLVHAESSSDLAPALLVLGASLRLVGPAGERTVSVDRFFLDFYEADVRPNEILTNVSVARVPKGARFSYVRVAGRSREDKPLVNVAALATAEGHRIAMGGVSPTPIRARRAEATLRGGPPTTETIAAAAAAAAEECDPLDDLMGSAQYRREMVRVHVRRALAALAA